MTRWRLAIATVLGVAIIIRAPEAPALPLTGTSPVIEQGARGAHFLQDGPETDHLSWAAVVPPDNITLTAVTYTIHDHGVAAAITAGEFQAFLDAAQVWNSSGALIFLDDVASGGTLHVHKDAGSGCGTFGQGVLGCAEFSYFLAHDATYGDGHPRHLFADPNLFFDAVQELTLLTGPNWYTGPAAWIGAGQYDFLTVAIQEFGHLLGLEHQNVADSPMNGTLPSGVTRRVLNAHDREAIAHLYGEAPPAAPVPEPATLVLLGAGLAGLAGYRRWRQR